MINYSEIPKFKKDLKKLLKRFPSLVEDIEFAKKAVINLFHIIGVDNQSVFRISNIKSEVEFYKIKKITCKSIMGRGNRSGIRIIYSFDQEKKSVEFIEIYFKGDKDNEDRERIKEYIKENLCSI